MGRVVRLARANGVVGTGVPYSEAPHGSEGETTELRGRGRFRAVKAMLLSRMLQMRRMPNEPGVEVRAVGSRSDVVISGIATPRDGRRAGRDSGAVVAVVPIITRFGEHLRMQATRELPLTLASVAALQANCRLARGRLAPVAYSV